MTLAASLRALGEVLAPSEAEWGDPELPAATLCPRLRTTYSPRSSWWGFGPQAVDSADRRPSWSRLWAPAQPVALGLSLAPNPKRPHRYGLNGFPAAGRRNVWRALSLLEEERRLLSFWTVSLPPEALDQLQQSGRWPEFQDRIRKELVRQLHLAGMVPQVVGVVELQPKRGRREGRPCPHLHIVFRGRRHPWKPWVLAGSALDRIIAVSLATSGVFPPDGMDPAEWLQTAGNVQEVKKSVRAYLACYLTKEQGTPGLYTGTRHETLLPHQWWFWSAPLRALVARHTFRIAFPFLFWVHRYRAELLQRRMIGHRQLDIPDPRAPRTWEVDWLSPEHLAAVVTAWQTDEWDAEWHRSASVPL